jgi:hypothetical protein
VIAIIFIIFVVIVVAIVLVVIRFAGRRTGAWSLGAGA